MKHTALVLACVACSATTTDPPVPDGPLGTCVPGSPQPIDTLPLGDRFSRGSGGPTARTVDMFEQGGLSAAYTIEAPASAEPVGLLVYFHGSSADATPAHDALLPQIVERIGAPKKLVVIAVAPPAERGQAPDPVAGWYADLARNVDFASALLDDVAFSRFDIDRQRVFLTGVRSGGAFASALQFHTGYRYRGGTIGLCGSSSPATIDDPALPQTSIDAAMRRGTRFYFADSRTRPVDGNLQVDASFYGALGFPVQREFPANTPPFDGDPDNACGFDLVGELARGVQATDPETAADCANISARPGIHELALISEAAFTHAGPRAGLATIIAPPSIDPAKRYGVLVMFHGDGGTPVYAEHQFAVLDDNLALAPLGQFLVDRDLIVVFMQAPAPPISVIAAGTRFPVGEDPVSAPIRTWSGAKDSYEGVPETNLADNRAYFVDVFDKQLKNLYAIDEDRVLLAGFSGGGEFASALLNPFLGYRFRGGSISLCGSVDPTNAEVVVPAPPDTPITDDIRSHYKMYFAINSGDDLIVPTRLAVDYFSAPGRFTPEQLRFDEFAPIVPQHCAFDDAATPEEETGLTFLVRGIEFVDPRR